MKPNSPIDALFEEYLESGSARALSAVFERAAPVLLRVGASAGLDRPSAEDALQECFLVIVRRQASYDRARPFMGWASGIMARQSRQVQRRLRREQDLVARLTRDLGSDGVPDVEALDDEAREQVVRALRPLPREQRDVLQLRFVEGLAPAEIARRLGIRPNAVSARIARGTRRLRDALAGPALGALLGVLAARPARGLEAVRTAVLRDAADGARTATGAAAFSPAAALTVAAAGITGIVAAGWALSDRAAQATSVSPAPIVSVADADSVRARPVEQLDALAEAPRSRGGVRVEESVAGAIRGRIVDGSGAPVPNASIVALRYDRHVHLPTEPPRAAAVSDADGRFRIDPAALEDPTPLLFARTGDLAGVRIVQDSDASSDPFELRVEPSKAMELRVVDTDGQPVEGATASAFPFVESMISPVDSAGDICDAVDALAYVHLFGARTDAAGRARIEGLPTSVAADAFGVLGVTHPAFVRHSDIVRWDRDESVVELRVRLSPARSFPLAGRVVDARGRGVSGALLTVAAEEPEAVADGTGAFTFDGLSPHAFPISVRCAAQGFEGDVRRITFADVGDPSFRLEFALRPLAVRHGRVVDESGQPVAGAEILSASTASTQQTVTGDDGTFCVEAGDGRALSIVAAVPSEADSPLAGVSRAVDVSPGASSFDVTLETPRARVPRVVFELVEATTGAPVDIERVALCSERGTVWTRVEVGGHRVVAEDVPAGLWSVFASVTAAESEGLLRLGHMSFEVSSEPGGPLRVPVFAPGYIELDVSDLRARGTDGVSVFACSHGTQLAPLWFYAGEANCETAQRSAFPESGPLVLGPLVHGTYTITSEGRSVLEDGSGIDPIRVDVVGGETVRARLVAGPSGVVRLDAPKSALRGRHDLEARRLPGGEWFVAARFGRRANEERSNEQSMPVGEYEWRYSQLMQDEHGDLRAVSPEAHGRFIVREGRTTRVRLGPADQVRPPKSSAE